MGLVAGMLALGMTLVMLLREIDLSVASTVGLSSVLVGVFYEHGLSIPVAGVLALVAGALCGAFNGFLVAYVGLPSLAVTIGTLHGKRVGLLWGRHAASVKFWPVFDEVVLKKFSGEPVRLYTRSSWNPAPNKDIEEFAGKVDYAFVGVGA